jgi:hypothetical protein
MVMRTSEIGEALIAASTSIKFCKQLMRERILMIDTSYWGLLYVLPNLVIERTFENEFLAIVPYNDLRLIHMCKDDQYLTTYLANFCDHRRKPIKPTVMIAKKNALIEAVSIEAVTSFRNIVALSILPLEWSTIRYGESDYSPDYRWSDSFDFYPVTYYDDRVFINEPGYRSFSSKGVEIYGSIAPHVYRPHHARNLLVDEAIYNTLVKCWHTHFIDNNNDSALLALFRSLELAYHALASPRKNNSSIYDLGISITLWVSAIETIIYALHNEAQRKDVSKLLGTYTWENHKLNKQAWNYKGYSQNLIQRAYNYLFDLRNRFSHGDPVVLEMLRPYGKVNLTILDSAPIIYRTVLFSFLKNKFGIQGVSNLNQIISTMKFEEPLINIARLQRIKKLSNCGYSTKSVSLKRRGRLESMELLKNCN